MAVALLAPWLAGLPWWLALPANAGAASGGLPLWRWSRGTLRRVVWQSQGRWVLVDTAGRVHEPARLLPGVYVGVKLLALHWRCACCRQRFRIALLADNCDADELRRLRVRLRHSPDAALFGDGAPD